MKKLIALILSLLCLSGCALTGQEPEQPAGEYGLWFAVDNSADRVEGSAVVKLERRAWKELPLVQTLLDGLLEGPQTVGLRSPFPEGVRVLSLRKDSATATICVDLSEPYGSLSGFDLTVADYCIVMTLCQIPWVNSVRILVEGEPIPYRNRQDLQSTDLLLTGIEEQPGTFMTVLYFPNRENLGLRTEYRQVERRGDSPAETVMTELLRGPVGVDANRALPPGTQILGLSVNGSVCQVDLSAEFVDNAPREGQGPATTLFALVNSLCALGGVSQVRVLVEGTPLQNYHGLTVSNPVSANYDFVKGS